MATWNDYKKHVRETNPEIGKDLDEVEAISQIVGAMIERRHDLNLSQRDLADLCGLRPAAAAAQSQHRLWSAIFRNRLCRAGPVPGADRNGLKRRKTKLIKHKDHPGQGWSL